MRWLMKDLVTFKSGNMVEYFMIKQMIFMVAEMVRS